MNAPTTTFRSILEKPLNQLTEDDISQLTREDCRKYLKEKGMRRPSWNKSQAIQQVISLKALLEPNDDSGAGALRKIVVLPHTTTATTQRVSTFAASNSADSAKEVSPDVQASVSADELAPHPRNEPPKPAPEDPPVYADTTAISLRLIFSPWVMAYAWVDYIRIKGLTEVTLRLGCIFSVFLKTGMKPK
ncbi:hypothetical protein C1H46_015234 [Malus baccata]|uniref:Uncharacterized protein n=1 Tax=Malus baccata TaxID=106549 RepID=A0A540MK02_MALBA|nr:hypothetical protein C1H46_015234 [Malus baccata]